jgi:protein gp37
MYPDWARDLRDQCTAARVPFFFKQWGEYWPGEAGRLYRGKMIDFTDNQSMVRTGKKAAGRELDGRTWDELPVFCL